MSLYTSGYLASLLRDNMKRSNLVDLINGTQAFSEELYTALTQVRDNLGLVNSAGEQVDKIGTEILSLIRGDGESDYDYKLRLNFRIREIYSRGTYVDLYEAFGYLTNATLVRVYELYNANILCYSNGTNYVGLRAAMRKIKAAGVGFSGAVVNGTPLVFLRDDGTEPDWGLGWSEDIAGPFAGGMVMSEID